MSGRYVAALFQYHDAVFAITKLAVAAHKYGCVESLRVHSIRMLMCDLDRSQEIPFFETTNCTRLVAAYLFDNDRAFQVVSGRLIKSLSQKYRDEIDDTHLPERIMGKFNQHHSGYNIP